MENKISFEEFKRKLTKKSHKHKITNSYDINDSKKYYTQNKPKGSKYVVTKMQYYSIIRRINNYLAQELLSTGILRLPYGMGVIRVYKLENDITYKDNKLIIRRGIDWNRTLKLWYEDEESFKKRTILKMDVEAYSVRYNKGNCNSKNRKYFVFRTNKALKKKLSDLAKRSEINVFVWKNIVT